MSEQNKENNTVIKEQKIENKSEEKSNYSKSISKDNTFDSKSSYKKSFSFTLENTINQILLEIFGDKLKIKIKTESTIDKTKKIFSRDFTLLELIKINKIFKTFDKIEDTIELFENIFSDKKSILLMKENDNNFEIHIEVELTKDSFILSIPKNKQLEQSNNINLDNINEDKEINASLILQKSNELKKAIKENEELKKRINTLEDNQNKIIEFFKGYDKEKENKIKFLENQLSKLKKKISAIFPEESLKEGLLGKCVGQEGEINFENCEISLSKKYEEDEEINNKNLLNLEGKRKSISDLIGIISKKDNESENKDNKKSFFKNIYKNKKINSTNELKLNEEENDLNNNNNNYLKCNNNINNKSEKKIELDEEVNEGYNYLYSISEEEIKDDIDFFNQNKKLNKEEINAPITQYCEEKQFLNKKREDNWSIKNSYNLIGAIETEEKKRKLNKYN